MIGKRKDKPERGKKEEGKDVEKPESEGQPKGSEGEGAIDPEVFEELPPSVQSMVRTALTITGNLGGPATPQWMRNLKDEHVHKLLDQFNAESEREDKIAATNRWFKLIYVLIGVGIFIFLTVYLAAQDKELYTDLIQKLIIALGGLGGGYGIRVFQERRRS